MKSKAETKKNELSLVKGTVKISKNKCWICGRDFKGLCETEPRKFNTDSGGVVAICDVCDDILQEVAYHYAKTEVEGLQETLSNLNPATIAIKISE